MVTYRETIAANDDFTQVSIKSGCGEKYARKLIQDYLKENTRFKGMWILTLDYINNKVFVFNAYNPARELYLSITGGNK